MISADQKLALVDLYGAYHNEVLIWGIDDAIPGLEGISIRWIAFVDGGMWRIKYGQMNRDGWWIIRHGNVLGMEAEIRRLVPCDDDAFAMYRF